MVILNLFQDLSAEKDKIRLAARCWNKFSMTFGGICYLYPHFGKANSILMSNPQKPSLIVKHFYFCHLSHIGFNMNRNQPDIVQKQTWLTSKNSPTGKKWFSNWEKIIFQQGNKNFPTGHFRLSSWIYTEIRFCKEFWWHTDYVFLTEEHYEQSALSFFDKRT